MSPTVKYIGIPVIIIMAWFILGCNKKTPEPVPATNLSDECYRSDRVKSCEITFKIEFREAK